MGYVKVPKDLTKTDVKVFMGLTKSQVFGFGLAIPLGALGYFLGSLIIKDLGMVLLLCFAFPPIFLSMFQRDGIPAMELAKDWLKAKQIRPMIRKYKSTEKNEQLNRIFPKTKKLKKKKVKKEAGKNGNTKKQEK